ncbi:MAG: hypothetical protein JWQ25_886 [Daejeonella sp.]|nr:hypothetical protein [Daejeonella sp.]
MILPIVFGIIVLVVIAIAYSLRKKRWNKDIDTNFTKDP